MSQHPCYAEPTAPNGTLYERGDRWVCPGCGTRYVYDAGYDLEGQYGYDWMEDMPTAAAVSHDDRIAYLQGLVALVFTAFLVLAVLAS